MSATIRVLVADDSGFMRAYLKEILAAEGTIDVVGSASNGKDAVEKTALHRPDVVVMDMEMGEYDGCYGIEHIMRASPVPIVILSAVGNSDFTRIERGLKLGAVDYVNKPVQNNTKLMEVQKELVEKITTAREANLKAVRLTREARVNVAAHTFHELNYDVVVIGSSTGGPGALETIIKSLPENMAVPVLIAQHMPSGFVPSFAARLNDISPLSISMARRGDVLRPGHVLIAPGSRNMVVTRDATGEAVVDFESKTYEAYNYPSVDGLMNSVAKVFGNRAIGVILTGMGRDGSEGMRRIREQGGYTIAQSKETCVVYGMPKEVVENGNACAVVNIDGIGGFIVSCLS